MNLFYFIIFLFLSNFIFAQELKLRNLYLLDTIIDTRVKANFSDFTEKDLKMNGFKNSIIIYLPSYKEEDSLHFLFYNLENYRFTFKAFYYNKLSDRIHSPLINSVCYNDSYLFIYSTYRNLIGFDLNNGNVIVDTILETCTMEKINLVDDKLIMTSTYNRHPKDCIDNTEIKIFSISKKVFTNDTFLNNADKVFSHFKPNQWISISKSGKIIFSHSTKYNFIEFDNNLNLKSNTVIKDSNFNKFNKEILTKFFQFNKEYDPKKLISFLKQFDTTIMRIERIHYLNDSLIFVSKIPKHSNRSPYHRLFDFFHYKNNKWDFYLKNIVEEYPDNDTKLYKSNYPLETSFSKNSLFFDSNYIILTPSSLNDLYNKTKNEQQQELIKNSESKLEYKIIVFKYLGI